MEDTGPSQMVPSMIYGPSVSSESDGASESHLKRRWLSVSAAFLAKNRVARSLALQTQAIELKNATNLESAFSAAKNWSADALTVLSNPLTLAYRTRIGELAVKAGLPAIYLYRAHVDAGGVVSYGPDLPDMFRRGGVYVGRFWAAPNLPTSLSNAQRGSSWSHRNKHHAKADWQFTTANARVKLKRLYINYSNRNWLIVGAR